MWSQRESCHANRIGQNSAAGSGPPRRGSNVQYCGLTCSRKPNGVAKVVSGASDLSTRGAMRTDR